MKHKINRAPRTTQIDQNKNTLTGFFDDFIKMYERTFHFISFWKVTPRNDRRGTSLRELPLDKVMGVKRKLLFVHTFMTLHFE